MEDRVARSLTRQLADHAASPNGPIIGAVAGYVQAAIAARVPDGASAAVILDEAEHPVIVAVSHDRTILLRVVGESTQGLHVATELLRLDAPDVRVSVTDTTVKRQFSNDVIIEREWLYELGYDRRLRLTINEATYEDDDGAAVEDFEKALAAAAGWPR